jgi:hypothetical protein
MLQIKYPQHRDSGKYLFIYPSIVPNEILIPPSVCLRQFSSFPHFFILSFIPGIYECQISTTPHMSHFIHLNVIGKFENYFF